MLKMAAYIKFVVPFLIALLSVACGSKILALITHPGFSHFKSFSQVLYGLAAERNHNMTIVTYFPTKSPHQNYNEIILKGFYPLNSYDFDTIRPASAISKSLREFLFLQDIGISACKVFFESHAMDLIWKSNAESPFDLVIMEAFNTDCTLGLAHILQKPIVLLSSCVLMPWHYDRVGLPDFPSYISSQFAGFTDDMTYLERLFSFIATKGLKLLYRGTENSNNDMIREYLNLDIDVRDIAKNVSLILVNQHFSTHGSRPLSNRVVEVGGMHISNKSEALPQDLDKFLNESRDGVIFISWGSLVKASSLPESKVIGMVNAMKKLKERIVWKWDGETKPVESDQFFVTNWVQQTDILCHPKVRLFWSHGGLLGTSEGVHCGVPMVITPMYGDQYLNAKAIQSRKMGKILSYEDITEENVYKTISEVLEPSYSWNAKYVSDVYRNRQNPPLETAIWWIEHVLHTKGSNLTYSPSVDMNWFTYYSLDAILTLFVAFLLAVSLPVCCIRAACRYCCSPAISATTKRTLPKRKTKTS